MQIITHASLLASILLALSLAKFVSSDTDAFLRRSKGIWRHRRGGNDYQTWGDAYTNARFTFYDAGQNACGSWDSNSDHVRVFDCSIFASMIDISADCGLKCRCENHYHAYRSLHILLMVLFWLISNLTMVRTAINKSLFRMAARPRRLQLQTK